MTVPSARVPSRRLGKLLGLGLGLALAVLVAACGDDAGSDETDRATSTSAPTTTASTTTSEDPEVADRQAVIDAYMAAEEAAIAASAPPTPNPDLPALLETHTGLILNRRRETILGLRANGWAIRYPPDSVYREEVALVEFDGADVAVLNVCAVDDAERFVVETGEVIASGLVTVQHTAAMQREDGVWKLAERREQQQWDGEAGCAVD